MLFGTFVYDARRVPERLGLDDPAGYSDPSRFFATLAWPFRGRSAAVPGQGSNGPGDGDAVVVALGDGVPTAVPALARASGPKPGRAAVLGHMDQVPDERMPLCPSAIVKARRSDNAH
jgi:hypothetical protein